MNNFFSLSGKDARGPISCAIAPDEMLLAQDLIDELDLVDYMPFAFTLAKLSDGPAGLVKSFDLHGMDQVWLDYQPHSLAWPLFSYNLKQIVTECLTGREGLNWISAPIKSEFGDRFTTFQDSSTN